MAQMLVRRIVLLSAASLLLSGCGVLLERWEKDNYFMVSAEDLDLRLANDPDYQGKFTDFTTLQGEQKREYLGALIHDSQRKCRAFLNGLTLAENTSNTSLDIGTTIFSALGTAFTPVSTIHAMTAGASILSGSKTAIDADIYGKQAIGFYGQTIQASYFSKMDKYSADLAATNPDNVVVALRIGDIERIHSNCSLAAAQSTLTATLEAASTTPSALSIDKWVATAPIKAHDKFSLVAASDQLSDKSKSIPIEAKTSVPADLANLVGSAVNSDKDLGKINGLKAVVEGDHVTVDLISPVSASVTWQADPASETIFKHAGPASPQQQSAKEPNTAVGDALQNQ